MILCINNPHSDYECLYKKICKGEIVACFVDYTFIDGTVRDVCACRRDGEYSVTLGARGITYGAIYPFHKKEGMNEKELFIQICEGLNLTY